jgi:phage-related baseplate assembly protein
VSIDLSALPPPQVIEPLDVAAILARKTARLIELAPQLAPVLALASEPLVKFLELEAYDEFMLRARINDAARGVLLATATGADLDNLAALYGLTRKVLIPAQPLAVPPVAAVMEADSDFRRRIQLAPDALSVAGPRGAYVARALSAHADVADASVSSPSPGVVRVAVLARSGDGAPAPAVLAAVLAALSHETVRPLTDQVEVVGAVLVPVAVQAVLVLREGPSAQTVMDAAEAALDAYLASQRRLGGDVTLSGLMAALHQPGVHRVQLVQPTADLLLASHQAPRVTAVTLSVGGRDD